MEHTPIPWAVSPNALPAVLIVKLWDPGSPGKLPNIPGPHLMADYRGGHIAELGRDANAEARETAEVNAAFIVEAVNTHARDKAAIKVLREALLDAQYDHDEMGGRYCKGCRGDKEHAPDCWIQEALKLSEGM